MSRKRRRRRKGQSSQHETEEVAQTESGAEGEDVQDRPSPVAGEAGVAAAVTEDVGVRAEASMEEAGAGLGVVVPEVRPGQVDMVKLAQAMATISTVNLDYQRRRLAESRPIEDYMKDPDIMASVEREEEAVGMLDPVTGGRKEPHQLDTPENFTAEGWEKRSEALPVSFADASRAAREGREERGREAVGGEGQPAEDPVEDVDEVDADEDDSSDAPAETGVGGSADGEEDTEDGGDGGGRLAAARVTETVGDAGSGSEAEPEKEVSGAVETGAAAEPARSEANEGVGGVKRSLEVAEYEAVIGGIRSALEGLAAGMNETVRAEIAARMDALVEVNRESSDLMWQRLSEGVKGLGELIPAFERGELAVLSGEVGVLKEKVAELRAMLPVVEDGDVPKLIAVLETFSKNLQEHISDFNWAREMEKDRGSWRGWAAGIVAVPLLIAIGLFGQHQLQVVPDGTNGWKTLVWESHGIEVAKCMRQAAQARNAVNCPLRVRPR